MFLDKIIKIDPVLFEELSQPKKIDFQADFDFELRENLMKYNNSIAIQCTHNLN